MAEGFVTRRGGGGIDVSDATATENDVLQGETFYSGDTNIKTGNIPSKSAETFTPGTTNQTISSGQYLSGTQTILGDADLIPENIVDGVTIFGVTGNAQTASYYLLFDGVDDYVQTPITGSFPTFTIHAWAFFDDPSLSTTSRNESLFGDWTPTDIHFGTRWSVGMHYNVNGQWQEIPNTNLVYGWNHYALVYDTATNQKKTYINGVLSLTETTNGTVSINNFKIGVATDLDQYYRGQVREFGFWTKVLTEQEIQNYISSSPSGNETDLFVYYDFNDGFGTTLKDLAGNNDGTIVGATWVQG